ncbi:MAG: thymidine phosphorylase [Rhodospirillales bacterium]
MIPQELIRRKRDGGELTGDEVRAFVAGMTDGSIAESQVSAFAMAVFFRGMSMDERIALTRAMTESGRRMDWRELWLDGPVVDKHSTGGVGDKVSLVLAPLLASRGGYVPMISGRGLGHTGGTLDKLESIPGYNATPDAALFRKAVAEAGCAIIGQTDDLAPADRRFYAIRDVTATVESVPLITASILSKKFAAGLDALVMDVKTGSGAFADNLGMARELAESIVTVANGAGLATSALITDMNQVLGRTAGNALEVRESVEYLTGRHRDGRLEAVTEALATELATLADLTGSKDDPVEHFAHMVRVLGGPADFIERYEHYLPTAPVRKEVPLPVAGIVTRIDTRAIGIAVIELGGGRRKVTDRIDHAVGLADIRATGETAGPGQPVCIIHARDPESAARAEAIILNAVTVGEAASGDAPVVIERVTERGQ